MLNLHKSHVYAMFSTSSGCCFNSVASLVSKLWWK